MPKLSNNYFITFVGNFTNIKQCIFRDLNNFLAKYLARRISKPRFTSLLLTDILIVVSKPTYQKLFSTRNKNSIKTAIGWNLICHSGIGMVVQSRTEVFNSTPCIVAWKQNHKLETGGSRGPVVRVPMALPREDKDQICVGQCTVSRAPPKQLLLDPVRGTGRNLHRSSTIRMPVTWRRFAWVPP